MFRYIVLFCMCIGVAICKDESCPPNLSIKVCDATCGPEKPCESPQLCCPTACHGSICVDPITQRQFVNGREVFIKKGSCPRHPGFPWMCTHSCITDSDCSGTLKCCRNRCGFRTCLQPRFLKATTPRSIDNNPS